MYSDRPPDSRKDERYAPHVDTENRCYAGMYCGEKPQKPKEKTDYERAKEIISAARTHIPKIPEYIDALAYIRSHNEAEFQAALKELQQKNPKAWIELQKSPLFSELKESRQFNNTVNTVAKTVSNPDKVLSNSAEYLERRAITNAQQRGYAPKPNPSAASKFMATSAAGTAISRVGGTVLQAEMMLLDAENVGKPMAVIQLKSRLKILETHHMLMNDTPEYQEIYMFIALGDYISAKNAMDDWVQKHKQ